MSEPDLVPIGSELRARKERRTSAITAWMAGQGAKIRANRPEPVYAACLFMAMERCGRSDWRHLDPKLIELCELRALSQGRVRLFGPKLPPTNEEWDGQIEHVRAAWAQPAQEAA